MSRNILGFQESFDYNNLKPYFIDVRKCRGVGTYFDQTNKIR